MEVPQIAIFSALAETSRFRIFEMLAKYGELSASDICRGFSCSASAISQHLRVLREARLVQVEKRAQRRVYRIDAQTMRELETWIGKRTREWNGRLDAMDDFLREEEGREEQ